MKGYYIYMKIFILIGIALVFYLLRANVMAAPILKIGDDAPTFTLPDSQGNQVSLSDYKANGLFYIFIRRMIRLDVPSKLVSLEMILKR